MRKKCKYCRRDFQAKDNKVYVCSSSECQMERVKEVSDRNKKNRQVPGPKDGRMNPRFRSVGKKKIRKCRYCKHAFFPLVDTQFTCYDFSCKQERRRDYARKKYGKKQ